ncbi:tRNA (adenosine(37)-N6)-threonylcarbamoyltransferase complex ATPase subunit type 1 TsaE [Allosphingosinicella vermicomposti]|uniref:tRNA (adenosine(37)-N6)-threonylcarbamoyltransferase complex ATPase subunit type 1 TsaE n=1 Tax=Allosphingosinicella vermicomposti TaxID=614671 RepID=UPI000D0F3EC0|nr:tRNA (adenosine(37)-N6)-threonylcarbamoyltransferase complex ATPase subunit type 1 TsaE [Allosphingosinicella vermicomposti]
MIRLTGEAETEALGRALAARLQPGEVVALHGDLGAGKTSLARGILRGLGFEGDVASPTFPIIQVYEAPDVRIPVWHIDLYRIEDESELEELALDDARWDTALIVEWPERLGAALWPDSLQLFLERDGEGARALTAQVPPAWKDRWPLP